MAMIKCKECQKEISSLAETCPHCGATTEYGTKQANEKGVDVVRIFSVILVSIGCLLILVALITMYNDLTRSYGGYNYRLPWTDHEIGVVIKLAAGIGMIIGSFFAKNKIEENMR